MEDEIPRIIDYIEEKVGRVFKVGSTFNQEACEFDKESKIAKKLCEFLNYSGKLILENSISPYPKDSDLRETTTKKAYYMNGVSLLLRHTVRLSSLDQYNESTKKWKRGPRHYVSYDITLTSSERNLQELRNLKSKLEEIFR